MGEIKKIQVGFAGMNQDISKSKRDSRFYFSANNIRITAVDNDSLGSLSLERGNTVELTLPEADQIILHANYVSDYIILFSSNVSSTEDDEQTDIIWSYNTSTEDLKVVFNANLNFSASAIFESEVYYENDDIIKIYWIDGINQLRFINILNPVSSEYPELLDAVPSYSISQPKLESTSVGGLHTSGRIQYAYNLAMKYGQQTSISPFSQLISLSKQVGGGKVNEIVGQINNIKIEGVDTKFDIIRVYAIKYTSYNQTPTVSLIAEEDIVTDVFRYSDDGRIIYSTSLEELLFLGGTPLIPDTISSDKRVLLLGGITEKYFDLNTNLEQTDSNYFDTRAYRFPKDTAVTEIKQNNLLYETVNYSDGVGFVINDSPIEETHDCINTLYNGGTIISKGKNTTGTRYSIVLAPNIYDESLEYRYRFDGLPTTLPAQVHYIDITIQSLDLTQGYRVDKSLEFSPTESVNFLDSLTTKLNSKEFSAYGLKIMAVKTSINVYFYLTPLRGLEETVELNTKTSNLTRFSQIDIETVVTNPRMYQWKSSILGASGNDLNVEIVEKSLDDKSFVLKSGEIYRFGIQFYNTYNQKTPPKWMVDLKMPEGINLGTKQLTLKVDIKSPEKLISQGVVRYRILRVERTDEDKTVLDQGIVGSSVYQIYDKATIRKQQSETDAWWLKPHVITTDADVLEQMTNALKMPTPLFRTKNNVVDYTVDAYGLIDTDYSFTADAVVNKLTDGLILNDNSLVTKDNKIIDGKKNDGKKYDASRIQPYGEIFTTNEVENPKGTRGRTGLLNRSITVQENKLWQFYTPEAILNNKEYKGIGNFKVVGKLTNTENSSWGKKYSIDTQLVKDELTKNTGLYLYDVDSNNGEDLETPKLLSEIWKDVTDLFSNNKYKDPNKTFFNSNGLIGPGGSSVDYFEYQYHRKFTATPVDGITYDFLETPLFVGTGERNIRYAEKYLFYNDLKTLTTDKNERDSKKFLDKLDEDDYCTVLNSVNSVGCNCYIFSEKTEKSLENILPVGADAIIGEFRRVLTNQYGGNTYESRSKNSYIEIGDSVPVDVTSVQIDHAGDVFVSTFTFARILPNLSKVFSPLFTSICEIIEVPLETSIDLRNRTDYSTKGWNSVFHPQESDFHTYNRVYNQEPIFTKVTANPYTFDPVAVFPNKITSTKIKTPGELTDSWTDVLVNEELLLNGKYGKITKLINDGRMHLAFQENAITALQVQPRIQQVTSDGIGVELGTGQILYDHRYITTSSGCVNKLSIFNSPSAIYYLDLGNKTFNRIGQNGLEGISDMHGMHTYFANNLDYNILKNSKNIVGGYDQINNDAYLVVNNNFAIGFNELTSSFTSFYNIEDAGLLLKTPTGFYSSNNSNKLWKHFTGDYGKFYGTTYDSEITLFVSPNSMYGEVIFNNLTLNTEYKDSEGFDVFYDESGYTVPFKSILVWNDYMSTNEETLVYPTNISRKFRTWNLFIPRDKTNIFNRMRGKHAFIKLKIDNSLNNTLVLHDVVLSYIDNSK